MEQGLGRVRESLEGHNQRAKGELFLGVGISDDFNLIPSAFLLSIFPVFCQEGVSLF